MRVALVRPPDPMGEVATLSHVAPTNLGYLAAYLMRDGIDVQIWDYEVEAFSPKAFVDRVASYAPDLIGFGCMTPTIDGGGEMARVVKTQFPEIMTVVGGVHSSALPEQTLAEFPHFDAVVLQEGEATLLEVCYRLSARAGLADVPGLMWREGDRVVRNEPRAQLPIDSIPWPARSLYQGAVGRAGHAVRGFSNRVRSTEVYTSRGCPNQCTFCAIAATFDRRVRFRDTDDVLAEIDHCRRDFGIQHFVMADDTFTLKRDRLLALCEGFRRIGVKSWNCDTRVDAVSPELLRAMAESGCVKVAFGIETGSPRVAKLNRKGIDLDQAERAVAWARQAGIRHVEGNFIIGSHPDENHDDIALTARMLRRLPMTFASITILVPYPGTQNYELMKQAGHIEAEDWSHYVMFGKRPTWRTTHFSADELLAIQKRLTRAFYFHPRRVLALLTSVRSLADLVYYVRSAGTVVRWMLGHDLTARA